MSVSGRARVGDFALRKPIVDLALPLAAGAWWYFRQPLGVDEAMRTGLYQGVAAVAGLALAAATFACSMTYQSANILLADVRKRHAAELRRNWQSVIFWMLVSAITALAAMVVDGASARWALSLALAAIAMVLAKTTRAIFWLGYTLFMDELDEKRPHRLPAPPIPSQQA